MKKLLLSAGLAGAVTASLLTFTAPAEAATGKCPLQATYAVSFCLYYNSNMSSAYYRWFGVQEVKDLKGYTFPNNGNGAGAGQPVKNNSAAASLSAEGGVVSQNITVRVFFNSGFLGTYDTVVSNTNKQLVNAYNEDASWKLYASGG
ncbi:hypothetical protein [Streptomyces sp. NPDC049040]|uniref:hypothetical protein n=1 Tax=Streptomyces sp. NPDC049040 TaxID=3365593 RepID=UPI00371AF227